jgi:hypothetical protein
MSRQDEQIGELGQPQATASLQAAVSNVRAASWPTADARTTSAHNNLPAVSAETSHRSR